MGSIVPDMDPLIPDPARPGMSHPMPGSDPLGLRMGPARLEIRPVMPELDPLSTEVGPPPSGFKLSHSVLRLTPQARNEPFQTCHDSSTA